MFSNSRMRREFKTVETMIRMYCQDLHRSSGELCPECSHLLDYASKRLNACPFQEGKTTCAKCPVHCYHPEMRERIRAVMKHAGPRMMHRHPLLSLMHLVDSHRKKPLKQGREL